MYDVGKCPSDTDKGFTQNLKTRGNEGFTQN